MNKLTSFLQFGACSAIAWLFLSADPVNLNAQSVADNPTPKTAPADEPSTADLLNSYRQVREQLQSTQLALAANRLEAEANARVQAAISEKIESIRSTMELERERHRVETDRLNAERDRQQLETDRANAERDRQQAEIQRFTRTIFWIALAFGTFGLVAMIIVPLLQWRGLKRIAEMQGGHQAALPASSGADLFPGDPQISDDTVAHSSRRLLSVIDRMEQRIFELEHTAAHPLHAPSANPFSAPDASRRVESVGDQIARIGALLSKGRTLLEGNRAREALSCFDEVLKIDLNHAEALVKRGSALEQLKQDDEAIQCYDRAIKADPKMTLAYLHKGGVCNRLQRYEEALECYEQALRAEEEGKRPIGTRTPMAGVWPAGSRTLSTN